MEENRLDGPVQRDEAATDKRLAAVAELAGMNLPAGSPEELERESVPQVEPLPADSFN